MTKLMKRMGEELLPVILENLDYIAHFHIAAAPKRNFPSVQQAPEYCEIIASVHAAGYRGYWGQEFLPDGEPIAELAAARALCESYIKRQPAIA